MYYVIRPQSNKAAIKDDFLSLGSALSSSRECDFGVLVQGMERIPVPRHPLSIFINELAVKQQRFVVKSSAYSVENLWTVDRPYATMPRVFVHSSYETRLTLFPYI